VQKVAQSWLVYDLTKSSFYLGLDDFLGQLPILLFTLLGGVIADRHDRRRLLIGSQYVQMTTALTLAALVYLGVVHVWHILLLSCLAGLGQAFGGPAYQSLIPSLVPKKDLPNAIALNSIQFNLARVFGSVIAGITLAALGAAACFTLNGLSFLIVIVALLSLTVKHIKPVDQKPILHEMKGGLSYARGEPAIVALTLLAFLTTFLGLPLLTFLPAFTSSVFGGEADLYSRLMAVSGTGAVAGALVVAWLGRFRHMGVTVLIIQAALGAIVVAFSASTVLWWSYALIFAGGAALVMLFSMMMSLVQLIVPDRLRGRVVSIYMVAFRGGMPLGSLVSGSAATFVTVPTVLAANGALVFLVAIYFLIRRHGLRAL
jgi:MFS family permease